MVKKMEAYLQIGHLEESFRQDLFNEANNLIDRARKLPDSGLYLHGKDNIIHGVGGTLELYQFDDYPKTEVDALLLKAMAGGFSKVRELETELAEMQRTEDKQLIWDNYVCRE